MRIRIKLYILSIFSVLLLLLVAATIWKTTQDMDRATQEESRSQEIIRQLVDLGGLTGDYLLHESQRAQMQWERKHGVLMHLVGSAAVIHPEDREILDGIRGNARGMAVAFLGLTGLRGVGVGNGDEVSLALKQRYMGQLDTRTKAIVADAGLLSARSSGRVAAARRRAGLITTAAIALLAGFMVIVCILFDRGVVLPLRRLQSATATIGAGHLDYKVDTGVEDEVGGLSRAFDEMTGRLKEVTVSRDELAREVEVRKRAEEEARLAKAYAENASTAKSRFLTNMSHELRTPLNSVIGFASLLLKNKEDHLDDTEQMYLQRILANGKHLLFLINQVLDLAKIEACKVYAEWRLVELRPLIEAVVGQLDGQAREKGISVVSEVPPGAWPLATDPGKVTQVLVNLVGNAIKFTEKGQVTVSLVPVKDGSRAGAIEVRDTGIGIQPDRHEIIFEAFQQAEDGTSRKYGGTGLGLAISRALCDVLGYRIEVESEPGQGSTFRVVIPEEAVHHPGGGETGTSEREVSLVPKERRGVPMVLVIDDDPDGRVLIGQVVESAGYRVVTVSSGQDGLRMARECHPDVITLDLLMPEMDGWMVLRQLKSDPALRDIPVVVVSIVAQEQKGAVLGAVDVLQKPVSREALLAVLARIVRASAGQILVVDDNEDDRRLLAESLRDSRFSVRIASSAREALRMIELSPPDAVVVDLVMPEVDGYTMIHLLRRNPHFRDLPVVVVTGREISLEERRMIQLQACAVLAKTGDIERELPDVLGMALNPAVKAPFHS